MSTTSDGPKIPDELRDFADKGLQQARGALGTFLDKARKGADSLQKTTQTADMPAGIAFARGLEFAEKNVAAAFDHAQKLVRATDVQEALKLQSDYVRTQFAAMKAQSEELAETVRPAEPGTKG